MYVVLNIAILKVYGINIAVGYFSISIFLLRVRDIYCAG